MRNALPAPTAAGGGGGGGACGWACGWGGAAAGAAAGTGGTLGAAAAGGAAGGAKGTWKAAAAAAGGGGAGAGGAGCGSGLTAAAKTCGACCWSWLSPTRPPPPGAPAGAGGAWWCCWPPACCGCCGCCCCWTAAAAAAAAAASVGSIRPFQARVGEGKDHLLRVASTQGTREDTWGSSRGRESPLAPGIGLCGCSWAEIGLSPALGPLRSRQRSFSPFAAVALASLSSLPARDQRDVEVKSRKRRGTWRGIGGKRECQRGKKRGQLRDTKGGDLSLATPPHGRTHALQPSQATLVQAGQAGMLLLQTEPNKGSRRGDPEGHARRHRRMAKGTGEGQGGSMDRMNPLSGRQVAQDGPDEPGRETSLAGSGVNDWPPKGKRGRRGKWRGKWAEWGRDILPRYSRGFPGAIGAGLGRPGWLGTG